MSKRRKLTEDERAKAELWALQREQAKYPGADVTVTVEDELDDDGMLHYQTVAFTVTELPKDWKP